MSDILLPGGRAFQGKRTTVEQKSYEAVRNDLKNQNVLQISLSPDSPPEKYLTEMIFCRFAVEKLKIPRPDIETYNFASVGSPHKELMLTKDYVALHLHGSYEFEGLKIDVQPKGEKIVKVTFTEVPSLIPNIELLNIIQCFGRPVDNVVEYGPGNPLLGGPSNTATRIFRMVPDHTRHMPNYFWLESTETSGMARVVASFPGQARQCYHCLQMQQQCPSDGKGKICKSTNMKRASAGDYMSSLYVSHGLRTCRKAHDLSYPSLLHKTRQAQDRALAKKTDDFNNSNSEELIEILESQELGIKEPMVKDPVVQEPALGGKGTDSQEEITVEALNSFIRKPLDSWPQATPGQAPAAAAIKRSLDSVTKHLVIFADGAIPMKDDVLQSVLQSKVEDYMTAGGKDEVEAKEQSQMMSESICEAINDLAGSTTSPLKNTRKRKKPEPGSPVETTQEKKSRKLRLKDCAYLAEVMGGTGTFSADDWKSRQAEAKAERDRAEDGEGDLDSDSGEEEEGEGEARDQGCDVGDDSNLAAKEQSKLDAGVDPAMNAQKPTVLGLQNSKNGGSE